MRGSPFFCEPMITTFIARGEEAGVHGWMGAREEGRAVERQQMLPELGGAAATTVSYEMRPQEREGGR